MAPTDPNCTYAPPTPMRCSCTARDITQLIRDTEPDLLFHHSRRKFDSELLYVGAIFHDIGLTETYRRSQLRFEVDGANAARDFLRSYGIPEASVEIVWDAIALHTTPGIPEHKKPEVALVTSGVEMDVLGIAYEQFTDAQRAAVVVAHPRGGNFKIILSRIENTWHRVWHGRPQRLSRHKCSAAELGSE